MQCHDRTSNLFQFKLNLSVFICVLFYSLFVCISAYAHVYSKTTIIKQNTKIILTAGVPSSQALSGYLLTAPPSVCVPDAIDALAVWIQNPVEKKSVTVEGGGEWEPPPGKTRTRLYTARTALGS